MLSEKNINFNNIWSIRVIQSLQDLSKVEKVWDEISKNQFGYHPFISFDWYQIWLKHFLEKNELLILILYKNDGLCTIAPFYLTKEKFNGIISRKIKLIGNVYSPAKFVLFKDNGREERIECLFYIFQYFKVYKTNWDIMEFLAIPEEDNFPEIFKFAARRNDLKISEYLSFWNWYSDDIDYSSEEFFKKRSRNLRASIKKNYRNAKKKGELQFKMISGSGNLVKYMDIYFKVYSTSWKKKESVGPDFHMDLMKKFSENGFLRLGIVFLDEIPVAVGFALVYGGIAYFEKTAYDERFERIGAGSIWLCEMIKFVIDIDKVQIIDLLRGDDNYKARWVEKRRERKKIIIFNKNLKGNYFAVLNQRILPKIRGNRKLSLLKEYIMKRIN